MAKDWIRPAIATIAVWAFFSAICAMPSALADGRSQSRGTEVHKSLFIADLELWLGMSKAEVDKRLAGCCQPLANEDGAFIVSKDKKVGIVGAIWFQAGRVSQLRRDELQTSQAEAAAAALRIYRLASQFGNGTVEITTDSVEGTSATLRTVVLKYPDGRAIEIWHSQDDSGGGHVDLKVSRR